MARPTKQGVDYFPLDVQFDDKIELLIAEKGATALSVLITAWQLTYQNEGYYIKWSNDLFLLIKRRLMLDEAEIESILTAAIKRNIFNSELFKKYNILTSKAIQTRYFLAAKKKRAVSVVENYLCHGVSVGENCVTIGINDGEKTLKEEVKEEIKVKVNGNAEVKGVSDSKNSSSSDVSARKNVPYQEIVDLYHKLLPTLRRVEKLSKERKGYIRQRWLEDMPSLRQWENFFNHVSQSAFLMGRTQGSSGQAPFQADLEWITRPNNFIKIAEGKYHVRRPTQTNHSATA